MPLNEAVIIDVVRTPLGKGKSSGALAQIHPTDLLAKSLQALLVRTGIDPAQIEDVLAGCVGQVGEQSTNIARSAALAAGFPEHVPGTTIDRQCGSSQQAAAFGAQAVMAGVHDMVIAAGVESMSRVPMGSQKIGQDHFGPMIAERYPEGLVSQGISAELIAARWQLDRQTSDEFASRSQRLAAEAQEAGHLDREIVPLKTLDADGNPVEISLDEGIRPTTIEALGSLKPVFYDSEMEQRFPEIAWTVTAGNSSQLTDGAAAMLVTSRRKADELGLTPRAAFRAFSVIGDDPLYKLTGIIPATQAVIERSGVSLGDIDLFEVNEAFASVVLAWEAELGVDRDRINVHGGAIALGHPLGASGIRLTGSLLNAMELRGARYGLQVMCEGGGMANAMIVESLT